jgi:hypothetical protein
MRAPQRRVTVHAVTAQNQLVLLEEYLNPTATQTIRITDPTLLQEMADGVIEFQLSVGSEIKEIESPFGDQQALWQVDSFRVSADGQVDTR